MKSIINSFEVWGDIEIGFFLDKTLNIKLL